jgi:beta-glucosidase
VSVSASATPGTVSVPITLSSMESGSTVTDPGAFVAINIAYPSLAAAFSNVGITADTHPTGGNFDGDGNSFSATALANAGIAPGATVTSGGVTFTWPNVAPGASDNVLAGGQTILLAGPGGGTLGFLGAASDGVASGNGTIGFADGTTQAFTIGFQNWISASAVDGDAVVATTSYFNRTTSGAARTPSLFAAFVALQSSQPVSYVTLPDVSPTTISASSVSMHIFAIGFS